MFFKNVEDLVFVDHEGGVNEFGMKEFEEFPLINFFLVLLLIFRLLLLFALLLDEGPQGANLGSAMHTEIKVGSKALSEKEVVVL